MSASASNSTPASGIRKAAILVASLDPTEADMLLAQLTAEEAATVRHAVRNLGQIDPSEQRRVMEEFRRIRPLVPEEQPAGIELDHRWTSSNTTAQPPTATAGTRRAHPGHTGPPHPLGPPSFDFLRDAEATKLASVLADERPQTIAVILSQLPSDQAVQLLARLSAPLQVDVIHRLVNLEETDPEVLHEVQQELQERLARHLDHQCHPTAGIQAVADMLRASKGSWSARILDNLATHDRALAERLCPRQINFDDLVRLTDRALDVLLKAVDPAWTMTALIGAAAPLIDRVVDRLPPREAAAVRRFLENPGPIRLSDVEEARRRIVDKAEHLALEGTIHLAANHLTLVT